MLSRFSFLLFLSLISVPTSSVFAVLTDDEDDVESVGFEEIKSAADKQPVKRRRTGAPTEAPEAIRAQRAQPDFANADTRNNPVPAPNSGQVRQILTSANVPPPPRPLPAPVPSHDIIDLAEPVNLDREELDEHDDIEGDAEVQQIELPADLIELDSQIHTKKAQYKRMRGVSPEKAQALKDLQKLYRQKVKLLLEQDEPDFESAKEVLSEMQFQIKWPALLDYCKKIIDISPDRSEEAEKLLLSVLTSSTSKPEDKRGAKYLLARLAFERGIKRSHITIDGETIILNADELLRSILNDNSITPPEKSRTGYYLGLVSYFKANTVRAESFFLHSVWSDHLTAQEKLTAERFLSFIQLRKAPTQDQVYFQAQQNLARSRLNSQLNNNDVSDTDKAIIRLNLMYGDIQAELRDLPEIFNDTTLPESVRAYAAAHFLESYFIDPTDFDFAVNTIKRALSRVRAIDESVMNTQEYRKISVMLNHDNSNYLQNIERLAKAKLYIKYPVENANQESVLNLMTRIWRDLSIRDLSRKPDTRYHQFVLAQVYIFLSELINDNTISIDKLNEASQNLHSLYRNPQSPFYKNPALYKKYLKVTFAIGEKYWAAKNYPQAGRYLSKILKDSEYNDDDIKTMKMDALYALNLFYAESKVLTPAGHDIAQTFKTIIASNYVTDAKKEVAKTRLIDYYHRSDYEGLNPDEAIELIENEIKRTNHPIRKANLQLKLISLYRASGRHADAAPLIAEVFDNPDIKIGARSKN